MEFAYAVNPSYQMVRVREKSLICVLGHWVSAGFNLRPVLNEPIDRDDKEQVR